MEEDQNKTGEAALLEKLQGMLDKQARDFNAKLTEERAKMEALRVELNKVKTEGGGGGVGERAKSIGQLVVGSQQFKNRSGLQMAEIDLGNRLRSLMLPGRGERAITTTLAPLNQKEYDADVAYLDRFRKPTVADLITWLRCSTSSVEYSERTVFYDLYANIASTASSGQADIVLTNAQGVVKGSTITIDPSGAGNGPETAVVSSVNLTTNTVTCTANLSNNHAAGIKVVADEVAPTAEGETAPQFYEYWTRKTATVKAIRAYIKITADALDDAQRLEDEIDMDLGDSLRRSVGRQILYGTGTNQELTGILNATGIQTITWSTQTAGTSRRDLLRLAVKLLRSSDRDAQAFLLHPDECAQLDLEKGNDGHYVMPIQITREDGTMMEWRLPVIETTEINSGTGLVGNYQFGCRGYDRQQDTIDMTNTDQDDFIKDLVTFRGKRRLALAVREPKAFVKITFDSAP